MEVNSSVSGSTKILGIIGNPIEHSISPCLHNTISRYLNVDTVYVPFKVDNENLGKAIEGIKALGVIGFNVTIPYKKEVIKFLDENSKEALLMGAVNTIKNINGRLYGYNTDAQGFLRSFKEEAGTGFDGKSIVIIGAGGAARAIAVKTAIEGASKVFILNRTLSRAQEIAGIINDDVRNAASAINFEDKIAKSIFKDSDIIINTTSLGMWPECDKSPVDSSYIFSDKQIVYDVIYNPLKTRFLKDAEAAGCKVINGLGMLFYQGIYSYEIWTDLKLSEDFLSDLYKSFTSAVR